MSITDDARPDRPSRPPAAAAGGGRAAAAPAAAAARAAAASTSRRRRTSRPSRACSAACCCPRTRSPTSSRSSSPTTSTGRSTPPSSTPSSTCTGAASRPTRVTVAAALADSGDLQRIGGVPYLHTLIESVPTAANASYYARIVSERAVLRRAGRGRHQDRPAGLRHRRQRRHATSTTSSTWPSRPIYDVTERRVSEDFAVLGRHAPADPRRDRGGRRLGRRDDRRADRLLRPGPAAQRPAPRPADHRGRPPRSRQVDGEHGLRPQRGHPAQLRQRHLLARNEQDRDRHAAALRRGPGAAARAALRPALRRRLDQAGPPDGRDQRGADLRRRHPEHEPHGDPGQGPPAQAAPQPQAASSSTTSS